MNKKTRAVDEETYKRIISVIRQGFLYEGTHFKPNERIATVLVLEYNLGLRVGDILQLRMSSFVRDGNRYHLDIYEQKTGKYRNFYNPNGSISFCKGVCIQKWDRSKGEAVSDYGARRIKTFESSRRLFGVRRHWNT